MNIVFAVTLLAASAACAEDKVGELFAKSDFTVMNIAPPTFGTEAQLAREMVEYRDRTGNDIVLYSLTLNPEGFPAMKKANLLIESYRKLKAELAGTGVRLGVLMQATLGHWPRVDKNEEPWMRSITAEGKTKRFCPLDPGYQRYLADVAAALAKEKPCFILLDDDVHASGCWGVECFCERHVAKFNRDNGTKHTAETLRAAVNACKPGDAVCSAFLKMQRAFVNDVVDLVRKSIDQVDPTIPSGACTPYRERRFAGETARRLAAKGQPTVLRIDNSLYGLRSLTPFPDSLVHTLAMRDYYRDVPYLLDESDSFPHNRWALTASLLDMKLQAAAFCGLNGSKLWFCNAHKGKFPISRGYTDLLSAHRGLYGAIAAAVRGSEVVGLVVPSIGGRRPWHPSWQEEFFVGADNWAVGMAGVFGVPFCVRRDLSADAIYALGGKETVGALSDAELEQLFRHRVLVDGEAALALTERGLSRLTGVRAERKDFRYNSERVLTEEGAVYPFAKDPRTPHLVPLAAGAEELTHLCYTPFGGSPEVEKVSPGAILTVNSLGAKVITTAFYAEGYAPRWAPSATDMRREWFLRLLRKIGWNDYVVETDQDVAMLQRRVDSSTVLLGVFNTSFDPIDGLRLGVPGKVASVEVLGPNGGWRTVGFHRDGSSVILPVSLACCNVAVLRVHE